MAELYATVGEERLHRHAMQRLADETGCVLATVSATWECELAKLVVDARIRDYLLIFAWRKTRDALAASAPAAAPVEPVNRPALAPRTAKRRPPAARWHWPARRTRSSDARAIGA